MLVENQMIEVRISSSNIKRYRNLGYKCKFGDIILVSLSDLSDGSHARIKVTCDYCGEVHEKEYREYLNTKRNCIIKLDCCKRCKIKKTQQTLKVTYGVNSPFESSEIREKAKASCLKRYGVEYSFQSPEILQKTKETTLKRYGVENYSSLSECREKVKNTCLKKYGVENPNLMNDFKEKAQLTFMKNYGYDWGAKSPEIRKKMRDTTLERYGVEYYSQTEEYKNKCIKTCMNKYGCPYVLSSPVIREKIKKTCFKKYGVKNISLHPKIRQKINESFYKNSTCKTSKQQKELYEIIKERYPNAILNYPCDRCIFDIALLLEEKNIKIDIEYDGCYWHKDINKDRRRDYYNYGKGWKVLRVKSNRKLPDINELFEKIEYLITTNHYRAEIILDDWKEVGQ